MITELNLREVNEQLVVAALHEREQADEAKRYSAEVDALLTTLHDGVIVIDEQDRVLVSNQTARTIFGLPDARQGPAPLERLDFELCEPEGAPLPPEDWPHRRALRGERISGAEYLLVREGDAPRRITFSASTIDDDAGRSVRAVVVCHDVTEERELARLEKEQLALFSHDLRTPLSAVLSTAEVLGLSLEEKGLEREARLARTLAQNSRQIRSMIEDLLDPPDPRTGGPRLRRRATDLARLVRDVAERLDPIGNRVSVEARSPEAMLSVYIDPERFQRAVQNLIANALKYSPAEAPVLVRVERTPADVVVSVIDRGVGISGEDLPRIFYRFYRGKNRNLANGLGLGLHIARQVVEAHGGRVWVESEVEQGSTFRIALPVC